jgi:4-aminobutyrate aminotransferase-like enzyme
MEKLLHAMGDVHPHALKAKLARELSRITFDRWSKSLNRSAVESLQRSRVQRFDDSTVQRGKVIFCNSGFEAVEAAFKTVRLATDKPGIIAFEGAYHGLGYGALNATHRVHFRGGFRDQLREFGHFVPFPFPCGSRREEAPSERGTRNAECGMGTIEQQIRSLFRHHKIGAILVEPMQARGGIRIPPPEFLPMLRRFCDEFGALLLLDEIYTGFGRTGKWFACEHSGVVPDVICLGKALTGGFPLSACVGRADIMDAAWPESAGEAIHTSTFLGHPVGCAMALAQIAEIRRLKLVERSARLGGLLLEMLRSIHDSRFTIHARGCGLFAGLELRRANGSPATIEALEVIKRLLHCGLILLPEGEHANVISFTPPLTITEAQLRRAMKALAEELRRLP